MKQRSVYDDDGDDDDGDDDDDDDNNNNNNRRTEVQRETRNMKDSIAKKTKERWHGKRMHGQLLRNLDEKLVDTEQSYRWLKSGDINRENRKYNSCSSRPSN